MEGMIIILLGLALLAYAKIKSRGTSKPPRFPHLQGWQKIFGVLAVILTVLIILNPELLALGLIGDSAFIDLLVLALSLQLRATIVQSFYSCVDFLSRAMRWLRVPSPGLRYLLSIVAPVVVGAVVAIQKTVQRFLS